MHLSNKYIVSIHRLSVSMLNAECTVANRREILFLPSYSRKGFNQGICANDDGRKDQSTVRKQNGGPDLARDKHAALLVNKEFFF